MKKGISLTVFFLLVFSALTFGAEIGIIKMQGVVMELDLKKGTVVISEKTFVWDQKTAFYNDKGSPIKVDSLKTKGWVYIEGENDKANKRWVAKKIYLLPKYIEGKERHLYPFIQQN
jgi:hypothetical protein